MENLTETQTARPTPITVICILGFTGAIGSVALIFSPQASQIGSWYQYLTGFSAIVGLITMAGLWKMKKWAFYLYIGMAIFNQIALYYKGIWNPFALMLPVLVALIVAKQYKLLK